MSLFLRKKFARIKHNNAKNNINANNMQNILQNFEIFTFLKNKKRAKNILISMLLTLFIFILKRFETLDKPSIGFEPTTPTLPW